jgi:hypothetical protein
VRYWQTGDEERNAAEAASGSKQGRETSIWNKMVMPYPRYEE